MSELNTGTAERFPTSEIAHIEIYGRMGKALARLKNLSTTGAFLELQNSGYVPKKGDLIRATVHLHQIGRSRVIDAEVIWTRGIGFGVCFVKKTELLSRMIHRN